MLTYIEKLRKKPKAIRVQVAFLLALSFTSLIMLVWMMSLPSQLVALMDEVTGAPAPAADTKTTRPWWQKLQVAFGTKAAPSSSAQSAESDTVLTIDPAVNPERLNVDTRPATTTTSATTTATSTARTPRYIQIATSSATTSVSATAPLE